MLLRHRSGLPDYTTDKMESMDLESLFSSVHYDYSRLQTNLGWLVAPLEGAQDSILRMIQHGKTHFSPGSDFEYNNSGYWLLAAIIEKCTGRSFGSNLNTRITSKLGMHHTCTAEQIVRSRTGSLHLKTTDSYYYCGGWQSATDLYLPNAKGAGNICATPRDLLVFMQGLYQGRLVSKKMLNLMADFYYKDSARPGQFGMGLERAFFTDHTLAVGHSGDTYYNHGTVLYFPDTGLGICCLLNGLSPQFDRNDMLDILYKAARNEQLENPVIDQWLPEPGQIDALLGSYYCDKLKMTINVLKDCRTVILYPRGQDALATYWTAPFQVSQPKYDLNVRFHADQPGFQLIQHGKTYNFVKQAAIKKD
jgi:CubicO group peptidase (beta-lactamase class C family)